MLVFKLTALASDIEERKRETNRSPAPSFFYQLHHQENLPDSNIYLLGTVHTMPYTLFPAVENRQIQDIFTKTQILVKEVHNMGCMQFTELFEFADVSLEKLREKGFFMDVPYDWPSRYLSSEDKEILVQKFNHDLQEAWGLKLEEVPPSIIHHCLKSQIEIRTIELLEKAASLIKSTNIENECCVTAEVPTIDNYISNQPFTKVYGLEDGLIRLEASNQLDELAKEQFNVSIEKLKNILQKLKDFYAQDANELALLLHQEMEHQAETITGRTLMEAYLEGDMESFIQTLPKDTFKRNQLWKLKIKEILQDNSQASILIVVGVAHLLGEKGLLNLLKAEGYNFTPINYSPYEASKKN